MPTSLPDVLHASQVKAFLDPSYDMSTAIMVEVSIDNARSWHRAGHMSASELAQMLNNIIGLGALREYERGQLRRDRLWR